MRHGGHMKKLIAIALFAAMLASATACSGDTGEIGESTADGNAVSEIEESGTPSETEHISTIAEVKAITLDEVRELISAVISEYETSAVMKLSDGSEISAEVKRPDITEEDVASGIASDEQMRDYMVYMSKVRTVVCDRLCEYFPDGNKVITESKGTIYYLFLDPQRDGFANANHAFSEMIGTTLSTASQAEYVLVTSGSAVYFEAGTAENTLLCPSVEENLILKAIQDRLNPYAD